MPAASEQIPVRPGKGSHEGTKSRRLETEFRVLVFPWLRFTLHALQNCSALYPRLPENRIPRRVQGSCRRTDAEGIASRRPAPGGNGQRFDHGVAVDELDLVGEVGDSTGVIGQHA